MMIEKIAELNGRRKAGLDDVDDGLGVLKRLAEIPRPMLTRRI